MNTCLITLLTAGGFLAGAIASSNGQPAPAARPAPIIITNAAPGGKSTKPYLSAGVSEILRMHEAGVDKSVILAFVQSSSVAYHPSAKEVIYLRDEGVPTEIISAMLKRGGDLRDRADELQREELRTRPVEQPAPPAPAPPAPAEPAQPQSSATVAPQTTQVIYATTPVYTYPARNYISFPSYGYGYVRPSWYGYSYANCRPYYWPSFAVGFGSSCYPGFGLSVGYGGHYGGYYSRHHGGYYSGYHGGHHGGGGWHHGW